jgi:hypothetical protein
MQTVDGLITSLEVPQLKSAARRVNSDLFTPGRGVLNVYDQHLNGTGRKTKTTIPAAGGPL